MSRTAQWVKCHPWTNTYIAVIVTVSLILELAR